MYNFDKYNKNFESPFTADTDDKEWTSLEALYEAHKTDTLTVRALFINEKAKYGEAPAVVLDEGIAYLPKNELENVREMIADSSAVRDINNGLLGIKIRKYYSTKFNKECYAVKYVTL